VLVGGSNDPYCAQARARHGPGLGQPWVDAGPAGHINTASGLGDWDAGHALLEQLMKDN
jgi:predicted alpha/beta hydrolase family esterase